MHIRPEETSYLMPNGPLFLLLADRKEAVAVGDEDLVVRCYRGRVESRSQIDLSNLLLFFS